MTANKKALKSIVIFLLLIFISLIFVEKVRATVVIINATDDAGGYKDGHILSTNLIATTAATMRAGDDGTGKKYRSFIDFNISIIPIGVTINNVILNLTLQTDDGSNDNIYGLNTTSSNWTNSELYAACGGGAGATTYLTNDASWNTAGINTPMIVDLGVNASANLTNKLEKIMLFFSS